MYVVASNEQNCAEWTIKLYNNLKQDEKQLLKREEQWI